MATLIERRVSALEWVDEEFAELECRVCHMLSFGPPMQHTLACPWHDPGTCRACRAPEAPRRRG